MYCVRKSSGRQTSAAPCCAASRIRATAFARFASGSSLMLICTSPILNLSGISFMPNYNSESLARRQDESQPGHVFGLLRSRRRRRVAIESALRVRPYYGGSERDGAKWAREPDLVIRVGEPGVASHILTAVVQPETHADDDIKRACEVDVARSRRRAGAETIGRSRAAVGADPAVAADRGCFAAEQVRQSVRVLRGELIVSHAGVNFRRGIAVTGADVVAGPWIPVVVPRASYAWGRRGSRLHGKGLQDHGAAQRAAGAWDGAQIRSEIRLFAMLAQVESRALFGHVRPRADRHLHELQDPKRAEAGEGDRGQDGEQLDGHLAGIPRQESVAAGRVHELGGEHTGEERPCHSGEPMAGE